MSAAETVLRQLAETEFNAIAALRSEFPDIGAYVAYRKAKAEGRFRVVGSRDPRRTHAIAAASSTVPGANKSPGIGAVPAARPTTSTVEELARLEWDGDNALHEEFGSFEVYAAWRKSSASGLVRHFGPTHNRS